MNISMAIMKATDAILISPTVTITPEYMYRIEVLLNIGTKTAAASTTETVLKISNHGLSNQDMIVNTDRKSTSDAFGNRGSRSVVDASDPDELTLNVAVTDQTSGDSIDLYHYTDKTGILKPGTFRLTRKGAGQSALGFQVVTEYDPEEDEFLFKKGHFIRVLESHNGVNTFVFWGSVVEHEEEFLGYGQVKILQSVSCESLNSVASRRTIQINESANTNYQAIVAKMVNDYLYGEGVSEGTVDAGAVLADDWTAEAISIKEVLDECAEKSGFMWFIDDNCALQFYREFTPEEAPYDLDPTTWKRYRNLKFASNANEYFNKLFFVGGVGETRDTIVFSRDDNTEIDAQQTYAGGTGAYGSIIRNTSLTEADFRTVEAGSTTTSINITDHAQNVGDIIWNYTLNEYREVLTTPTADNFTVAAFSGMALPTTPSATAEAGTTTTNIKITAHGRTKGEMIYNETQDEYRRIIWVDADNIGVETITGQVAGNSIRMGGHIIGFFGEINTILGEKLKKQSVDPTNVSFSTPDKFEPLTKLTVDIPTIGQTDQLFLIEDVEIYDVGKGLGECWYNVKATKRNATKLSTQRKLSYLDFWRDF